MKEINILNKIDYVDAIMIVDRHGKILYSEMYNPRFYYDDLEDGLRNIVNKNLLEVYPKLNPKDSTIIRAINEGKIFYNSNQAFSDYKGRVIKTSNLTIPIIVRGKIFGAIELSKDITTIEEKIEKKIHVIDNYSKNKNKNLKYSFEDIITSNRTMLDNIKRAKIIADNKSSVIVYGETGTGKELYVQSIHNHSNRREGPFVVQNCAALPENLFESIFFGSVKGAFTGALDKAGLFEQANGGTLFLDEVNSMPINMQAKLLRVLQDGKVRRVGDNKDRKVDVRIISAMNIEPIKAMEMGQLREDLFYRLSIVNIKLLPLRDRKEDIMLYIDYFINFYNKKYNKSIKGISNNVKKMFFNYEWPGNVRELQHIIESSINFAEDNVIRKDHLPVYLSDECSNSNTSLENIYNAVQSKSLDDVLEKIEKDMIISALRESKGNITDAAFILKITRQSLHYKLNKYRIEFS